MNFVPFSPDERVDVIRSLLPHWQQKGRTYFITSRTADSIPIQLWRQWQSERDAWLHQHGITVADLDTLPSDQRREYHERFSRRWQDHLDDGHGECPLRRADLRAHVEAALRHFDGHRYDLGDFVLMWNHVHVLVTLNDGEDIQKTCFSWKRFSAGAIQRHLRRHGEFWQPESFDHIIRHEASLRRIQTYIADNPAKACLTPGEYTHYRPEAWH